MTDKQKGEVKKLIERGAKFIGFYGMGTPGYTTELNGETPVEAIKYFHTCYNAILYMVYDVKKDIAIDSNENPDPDERGAINRSFFIKKTGVEIFDEDALTRPIVKLKPSKISESSYDGWMDRRGRFFECGHQEHIYLAKELFLSKTVLPPNIPDKYMDKEKMLETLGWVRVSSKGFRTRQQTKLSASQKKSIIRYMEILGDEQYEYQYWMAPKAEIEIELMK